MASGATEKHRFDGRHNDDTTTDSAELDSMKTECKEMVAFLKKIHQEEMDLRLQNEILAREALANGFEPGLLEPPAPKRRKPAADKSSEAS